MKVDGRSNNTANPNDNYKFTGHERDDEAGLKIDYMNARTYDPITARFMQIDPLTDQFPGWTPYHYVHNNPLNLVDPTGMSAEDNDDPCKINPKLCEPKDQEDKGEGIIPFLKSLVGIGKEMPATAKQAASDGAKKAGELGDAALDASIETVDTMADVYTLGAGAATIGTLVALATKNPAAATASATLAAEFFAGGTALDVTSTTLKTVDATFSDGNFSDVRSQATKTGVNFVVGRMLPSSIKNFKVNSAGRVINAVSGRYVSTSQVLKVGFTAAKNDATRIGVARVF